MLDGIIIGLTTAFTLQNIAFVIMGCLVGTFIGMLPGLGPMSAIALMIPVAASLEPSAGIILMAAVYYGAIFGGSTSSILINAPGVASTVATSFDGYPMAKAGKAGKALRVHTFISVEDGGCKFLIHAFNVSPIFRKPESRGVTIEVGQRLTEVPTLVKGDCGAVVLVGGERRREGDPVGVDRGGQAGCECGSGGICRGLEFVDGFRQLHGLHQERRIEGLGPLHDPW